MKKVLFMLLFILAGAQSMKAATAYVTYGENHISFRYDNYYNNPDPGFVNYPLNSGSSKPGWLEHATEIKYVNFWPEFTNNVKPTTMYAWFEGMTNLTSFTGSLNTSEVTTMGRLFFNCTNLTSIDLSKFDTSKTTDMYNMFYGCSSLKSIDLSTFNTSNVTDMSYMFFGCKQLTQLDLTNFNTSSLEATIGMFAICTSLKTIYVGSQWKTYDLDHEHKTNGMFTDCTSLVGGNGTTYDRTQVNGVRSRVDAAPFAPGYFSYKTTLNLSNAYVVVDGTTLRFCYNDERDQWYFNVKRQLSEYTSSSLSDDIKNKITKAVFEPLFALCKPNFTTSWFQDLKNLTAIEGMENLNTENVTNMVNMFRGCSSIQNIDVTKFNTSKVTIMEYLFEGCSALKSIDVTGFDTKNVTSMISMFGGCSSLTSLNVGNFNTSKVTTMRSMFSGCSKLTNLNLTSFNTSNVVDMSFMFKNCTSLGKLSLSYMFSTSNVNNMYAMFDGCSKLTNFSFLTYFNTAKVTNMNYMFNGVSLAETLDLSTFNTGNVNAMSEMFRNCSELRTIYIGSGWSTAKVTMHSNMFLGCTKIRGMQGTTYNSSYVDKTYARLDEGTSKPGYLSTITYNLKVGGVEVTDMNKDNIPIASGTAKFNGSVLVLTDATVAGNASWGSIHCTRDNLTIAVNGSCTLNGTVNFRGSSYIYFTDNDDDDELTVNGMFNFKGSLQFYNKKTVINTSSASYIFMGDGTTSKLEFGPKATVLGIMNGGTQIAYNITGVTFKSPTSFTFGSLGADDSQVSFSATQKTILMDGQPLKGAFFVGQYYPLWFGDLQMSSTIPLYIKSLLSQDAFSISEADDGTLVMKTYPLFAAITYNNNTFRSEAENLRVELGCDWTVKSEDANTPAMILQGNTTITGTGKLKVESAGSGVSLEHIPNVCDGNLTIDGMDMEVNAARYGVVGTTGLVNGSYYIYYNTLTFKNSTATITDTSGWNYNCLHNLKDLVLIGCRITNGVTFENNMINAPKVVIGLGSSYDLNNDGKVSTADIQVIINEMKKPQASQNMDYDLNNDGKISTADIQVIINEMKK